MSDEAAAKDKQIADLSEKLKNTELESDRKSELQDAKISTLTDELGALYKNMNVLKTSESQIKEAMNQQREESEREVSALKS